MRSPLDRMWVQRATRRYGRLVDAALRLPDGIRRDLLLNTAALLMRLDRKAFVILGR